MREILDGNFWLESSVFSFYNFFASLLRSLGKLPRCPLVFLAVSQTCLNIILDWWFVAGLNRGVAGAAEATVISRTFLESGSPSLYTYQISGTFYKGE